MEDRRELGLDDLTHRMDIEPRYGYIHLLYHPVRIYTDGCSCCVIPCTKEDVVVRRH